MKSDEDIPDEIRELMSRVAQSQATIALLGGMAHEFKNAFHSLESRCIRLERLDEIRNSKRAMQEVRGIQTLVGRYRENFASWLELCQRGDRPEASECSLADVVRATVGIISRAAINYDCEIITQVDDALSLEISANNLQTILLNGAMNSLKAQATAITILSEASNDSEYCILSVIDDGTGVDPNILETAFEAFTTTSTSAAGLGLHVSRMIAEQCGGKLRLESLPEQRTRLVVTLPIAKQIGEQGGADQPATALKSKPEGNSKPKPESEGRRQ